MAVPQYREQYLRHIHELAEKSLAWDTFGPVLAQATAVIDDAVKAETRKLGSYDAFVAATRDIPPHGEQSQARGGHGAMNLKDFTQARRAFPLNKEIK